MMNTNARIILLTTLCIRIQSNATRIKLTLNLHLNS